MARGRPAVRPRIPALRGRRSRRPSARCWDGARAIAIEAKEYDQLALADCRRAIGFWLEDKLDSARADVDEAKAALAGRARRDPSVEAVCLEAEGKLLQATGNPDSAVVLLKQAVDLASQAPEATGSRLTNSLAEVLRLSGRTREAVPYFRQIQYAPADSDEAASLASYAAGPPAG